MEESFAYVWEQCQKMGIVLSDQQKKLFFQYYDMILETNKVMNLTAITEPKDIACKHFLDSLMIASYVDMKNVHWMIDIGTGAGFPGIPLKIAFPHLKVCLLDSLQKRIHFLNSVIETCELKNIEAIHSRAEDLGHQEKYREHFDLCVSRAVANLSTLSELCLPFVRPGGLFVPYKTDTVEEELGKAEKAIHILGGAVKETHHFSLPQSDYGRSLVIIKKKKKCSPKYPRKAGLPGKSPLSF